MIFDILLLVLTGIFLMLFLQYKATCQKLEIKIADLEKQLDKTDEDEEFKMGLREINNENIRPITVDSLTGLPSRESFDDRFLQVLNQSKRFEKSFGILLLDINEFHLINEAEGYEVGDKLLKAIANRLAKVVRQIDTMTRYMGDTFMFLLPQLAMPQTAAYVAQRLLDSIVLPFIIDEKNIHISASIGIGIYPMDGADAKMLISNALKALQEAKSSGINRYQFHHKEIHALSKIELQMNAYFSNEDVVQKLQIQYQPYVRTKTTEIFCIQASAFFEIADCGLVNIAQFSRVADKYGNLVEIGISLLSNSILQFQQWHKNGTKPESLLISLTTRLIENPQFINQLPQILQAANMNPNQIIFELCDENLNIQSETLEKSLSMIHEMGIQISISLFALGHLALQKITKIPVDYLKIDSKIIQEKKSTRDYESILHMIVTLANDMHIVILADGVDTQERKEFLEAMNCEIMQGKLFGDLAPMERV